MFGLNSFGKVGVIVRRAFGGGSFSPLDLFASGEQGAWYDPSDLSTMFQDSAGTTPVTADGQPVGKILDKSGRGNHASQATAAKRPLYKTSGGLHWLQFDGVDDALATASIDFTSTDKIDIFVGAYAPSAATSMFLELSTSGNLTAGAFYITDNESIGGLGTTRVTGTLTGGGELITTPPDLLVLTNQFAITTSPDNYKARVNGLVSPATPYGAGSGTGNFGNYPLFIGARNQASSFFNGRIYPMIVLGRLATTQEITDTETWVAEKTGVVLP